MAPGAPLWQTALVSFLAVMVGQWWVKKRPPEAPPSWAFRLGLRTARLLSQYRGKRRGDGIVSHH